MAALLSTVRSGGRPTHKQVVATIDSFEELDAYRRGLGDRAALTGEALEAIEQRRGELRK